MLKNKDTSIHEINMNKIKVGENAKYSKNLVFMGHCGGNKTRNVVKNHVIRAFEIWTPLTWRAQRKALKRKADSSQRVIWTTSRRKQSHVGESDTVVILIPTENQSSGSEWKGVL